MDSYFSFINKLRLIVKWLLFIFICWLLSLFSFFISGCSFIPIYSPDNIDKSLFVASSSVVALDVVLTSIGLQDPHFYETNPFLSSRPPDTELFIYFLSHTALSFLMLYFLKPVLKKIFFVANIFSHGYGAYHNFNLVNQ